MKNVVETHGLVKRFGRTPVLEGLDLQVPAFSIFALVGSNGVGKSTTLKTLLGVYQADAGTARILGKDSGHLQPADLAQIGFVSESSRLPDWMTVAQFLAYLKPMYPTWDEAAAAALVRQFDLPQDRALKHLSRGMRMKAALIGALAYRPKLLILDEPFSGLDAAVRDDLIQGVLEQAEETSILISSHDLAEIESFASHVGYLESGRLQFSEEMASLTARFREVEVSVDSPPSLPSAWPATWLKPETASAVVRFVESRYDGERTATEVRRVFPDCRRIEIHAMALRSIFVALARASRKAA
jgi:ABC-2 type transport system ATP-binding protein